VAGLDLSDSLANPIIKTHKSNRHLGVNFYPLPARCKWNYLGKLMIFWGKREFLGKAGLELQDELTGNLTRNASQGK
jgi:hypothetical protein